jgi:thiosulfate dehydrogenase
VLSTAVHSAVRRHDPELPNPVAPTEENLIAGEKIFHSECDGCHGALGKPDPNGGTSLYPPIPQLAEVGTQHSEAQIFWVAKHGIRRSGMFTNGKWDADEILWTVAAFIKRINSLPPAVQ